MPGIQELIIIILIIIILSVTGLWPTVMQGLRELRGERTEGTPSGRTASGGRAMRKEESDICFRLLGISPSSTWAEIEKAYRAKAKLHHPDLGGDEDAMRTLNEAYNQLKRLRGRK